MLSAVYLRVKGGYLSKFTEDKDTFLFLISIKAGGSASTLLLPLCFILDPWWNRQWGTGAEQGIQDRSAQ